MRANGGTLWGKSTAEEPFAYRTVNDVPIGPALDGIVRSPLWSYQLGFLNGWMLTDLRGCVGVCAALGAAKDPFDGVSSACKRGAQMPRKSSHGRRGEHRDAGTVSVPLSSGLLLFFSVGRLRYIHGISPPRLCMVARAQSSKPFTSHHGYCAASFVLYIYPLATKYPGFCDVQSRSTYRVLSSLDLLLSH
jgi:hypothetical protein